MRKMNSSLNIYGDSPKFVAAGYGADIASQRMDELDALALQFVEHRNQFHLPTYAVDVACGEGGQSLRLAQAGAQVLAMDIINERFILDQANAAGLRDRVDFMQCDMRRIDTCGIGKAEIVFCQRAIHYLKFFDALDVVSQFNDILTADGYLYISASGINSELAIGYDGGCFPLDKRYMELAPDMRDKHGIHGPVCLYSEDDMKHLLRAAGFTSATVFSSPFGNIKAVATHA